MTIHEVDFFVDIEEIELKEGDKIVCKKGYSPDMLGEVTYVIVQDYTLLKNEEEEK